MVWFTLLGGLATAKKNENKRDKPKETTHKSNSTKQMFNKHFWLQALDTYCKFSLCGYGVGAVAGGVYSVVCQPTLIWLGTPLHGMARIGGFMVLGSVLVGAFPLSLALFRF